MVILSYLLVLTYVLSAQKNRLIEMFFWVPTTYILVEKWENQFLIYTVIWWPDKSYWQSNWVCEGDGITKNVNPDQIAPPLDLGLHCLLRHICPNTYSIYGKLNRISIPKMYLILHFWLYVTVKSWTNCFNSFSVKGKWFRKTFANKIHL